VKFCFSTFSCVLLHCKKPSVTQKDLITKLLEIIDSDYTSFILDEPAISNLVRGVKNLSPEIGYKARNCAPADVKDYFKRSIIPLLNHNKKGNLVLVLKDLIANDNDIEPNTIVDYVSKQTKGHLLSNNYISLEAFLSGLFLYAIVDTKNKNTRCFVNTITSEYILSFDDKKHELLFEDDEAVAPTEIEKNKNAFEYSFDEDTLEDARIFCLEHETDLHLLPICEMASILNPRHYHINSMINSFNMMKCRSQKAILVSAGIKPYKSCSWNKIEECIKAFEREINERGFSSIQFLYDDAKLIKRSFERYPDFKPDDMNPHVFKRRFLSMVYPTVGGDLRDYIQDYEYGLIHHAKAENIPPFDWIWNEFDLSNCDEKTVVFWVNRFVITVCHYLHGFDCNADYDECWKYKDVVDCSKLSTMEEMYYYTLFLLYKSYNDEKDARG